MTPRKSPSSSLMLDPNTELINRLTAQSISSTAVQWSSESAAASELELDISQQK